MKHLGKILIAAGALALSGMGHAAPVATWQATTTGLPRKLGSSRCSTDA